MLESCVSIRVIPQKEQPHICDHAHAIEAQRHLPLVALLRGQLEVPAVPANAAHGVSCLPLPRTRAGIVRAIKPAWGTRVVETTRVAPPRDKTRTAMTLPAGFRRPGGTMCEGNVT